MGMIETKIEKINKALEELETVELSNETKKTILDTLKQELNFWLKQKDQADAGIEFVENGFGKN